MYGRNLKCSTVFGFEGNCLSDSGLVPEPMDSHDDKRLLEFGMGLANIVQRTTRTSSDLKSQEIKDGAELLVEKLKQYQPKIAVFNGKGFAFSKFL